MNKTKLSTILSTSKSYLKKNSATILSAISAIGVVITAVETWKAAIKADEIVRNEVTEQGDQLNKTDVPTAVVQVYAKPVLFGTATILCIFGANALNKRQQAMISSAYALVRVSFDDYRRKLKELYGEDTHNKIMAALAVEKTDSMHITNSYLGVVCCDLSVNDCDGHPKLFYDIYSKRYFEATIEKVLIAEYHLNRNYALRGHACLNELYGFLGLTKQDYGEILGWSMDDEGEYWIEFNHRKVEMDGGLVCYILEMPFEPHENYLE